MMERVESFDLSVASQGDSVARRDSRRAVVTGGAGFIGSHLCDALLRLGFQVHCLDNYSTGSPQNVAQLAVRPEFELTQCDVAEHIPVSGSVDLVIHCACPGTRADQLAAPLQALRSFAAGTMRTLDFAYEHRSRFVLVSSSDVYGVGTRDPQTEHVIGGADPSNPDDGDIIARRFAETATAADRAFRSADTAIVRVFNTYGPRMPRDSASLVSRFIDAAIRGESMLIPGSGTNSYPLCYVEDIVRGILSVAFGTSPGPVNLGDPYGVPIATLALLIAELVGSGSRLEYVTFPAAVPRVYRPDIRLAQQLFGWRAETDLSDGLAVTIRAETTAQRRAETVPA
jgi:dTDP-glucose 4,6-dehydratase